MNIKELRLTMMKSKKTDPERSKVLQSVLSAALMIAKNDGNREATDKDIISAAKKEIKMAEQSRDAGAPYNELTFGVCGEFLPRTMTEDETINAIELIVGALPEKSMKMMGQVMKELKETYESSLDASLASRIVREKLNS